MKSYHPSSRGLASPPSRVMQFCLANTIRLASTPVPGVSGGVGGRVDTTARYRVEGEDNAIPFCRCFAWGLQTTILGSSQAGCNKHLGLWCGAFMERKATHSSYKTCTVQTKPWVIYYSTHTKHIMEYDMGNIKLNGSFSLPSWLYLYRWWSSLDHGSILDNKQFWRCIGNKNRSLYCSISIVYPVLMPFLLWPWLYCFKSDHKTYCQEKYDVILALTKPAYAQFYTILQHMGAFFSHLFWSIYHFSDYFVCQVFSVS